MVNSDDTNRENFYSVLKKKLEVYRDSKQHLDRFLSTDFNVFKWIEPENKDLLPDQIRRFENRRSAIIADLLNPSGSHGQDRKFLDAFLDVIKRPDLKDKKRPKVDRESPTYRSSENPRGQIDILVEFENFGLGIENKLDADEQKKQLQGYYEHLKEEYGDQGFCLVFITPDGRKPNSIEPNLREELMNKEKSQLVCVSYSTGILEWLKNCCQLCESDKFRWFLRDFIDHINGGQTMSMGNKEDIIRTHALESRENLGIMLDVYFNGQDVINEIINAFLDKLKKRFIDKQCGVQVTQKTLSDKPTINYRKFFFTKESWRTQYQVGLETQEPNECPEKTICIGVLKPDTGTTEEEEERTIKSDLDGIEQGDNGDPWVWWVYYDGLGNWFNGDAFTRMHFEENTCEKLGDKLARIIEIIDEHFEDVQK